MNRRIAASLAWSLWGLSLALGALGLLLVALLPPRSFGMPSQLAFLPFVLAYSTVGAVVASRRPHNLIGWLFCAVGLLLGVGSLSETYAIYGLFVRPHSLPQAGLMAWARHWLGLPAFGLVGSFLLLLFPTGRLPSPRWRPLAWLAAGMLMLVPMVTAFAPGTISLEWDKHYEIPNRLVAPMVVERLQLVIDEYGEPRFSGLMLVIFVACAGSLVVRSRSARGEERQQIKWIALSGSLFALGFTIAVSLGNLVSEVFWDVGFGLAMLAMLALPICTGIAILKYRLYDIDRLINRTLVYGALTLTLAAVYFGGVVVLQQVLRPVTQGSEIAVAGSTLTVAAVFRPARSRIQAFIDRRFYRRKYDAAQTLEAFAARLRQETDLNSLREDLLSVTRETVQPAHASLWLRPPKQRA